MKELVTLEATGSYPDELDRELLDELSVEDICKNLSRDEPDETDQTADGDILVSVEDIINFMKMKGMFIHQKISMKNIVALSQQRLTKEEMLQHQTRKPNPRIVQMV